MVASAIVICARYFKVSERRSPGRSLLANSAKLAINSELDCNQMRQARPARTAHMSAGRRSAGPPAKEAFFVFNLGLGTLGLAADYDRAQCIHILPHTHITRARARCQCNYNDYNYTTTTTIATTPQVIYKSSQKLKQSTS